MRLTMHSGFGSQWDVFGDQIQTLARSMPWMTVEGNHERDYPDSKDRYHSVLDSGDDFGAIIQPFRHCVFIMNIRNPDWGLYDPLTGGECGVTHEKRFKMPLPAPGAFWYSFDFGPIHFLQYSTEVPFDAASEQYRCRPTHAVRSPFCPYYPPG